jgi:hypothetical protein
MLGYCIKVESKLEEQHEFTATRFFCKDNRIFNPLRGAIEEFLMDIEAK